MNVMVTGATGYLGAQVVRALLESGASRVTVLARNADRAEQLCTWCGPDASRLRILLGDVNTLPRLPDCVDAIVHAAALRPLPGDPATPAMFLETNVGGTSRLLHLAAQQRVQRFIYISSQSVYGCQPAPWTEKTPPAPDGPYAMSKYAAEQVMWPFGDVMQVATLRLSRLYGVSLHTPWNELVGTVVRRVRAGQPVRVYGDGTHRLDLIHVHDAAEAVTALLRSPAVAWGGAYNVGSGGSVSVNDLVALLTEVAVIHDLPTVTVEQHPEIAASGPAHLELDISHAREMLGWLPRRPLREGLAEYLSA